MNEQDLFEFLKKNLSVTVQNSSEPVMCGGEVDGSLGVRVILGLRNPATGEVENISTDESYIWY